MLRASCRAAQASTPSAAHTPLSRSMGTGGGVVDHDTAATAAAAAAAGHLERAAAAAHLASPVAPAGEPQGLLWPLS